MTLPKIECALCKKEVEKIEVLKDYQHDSFLFQVWCHGDSDICELSKELVLTLICNLGLTGTAFARKRLDVH